MEKNRKYLGINLMKRMQDLFIENKNNNNRKEICSEK